MKVILIKDVVKVGNKYDVKEFSDGYAQNVLISKGLAIRATPQELAKLEERKKSLAKKKQEEDALFTQIIDKLKNCNIKIQIKSNEKGHLFRAVQKDEIAKVIKENTGNTIELDEINFPKNIKEVGTHKILLKKGGLEGEFDITIA